MQLQQVRQQAAIMPGILRQYGFDSAPLERSLNEYDSFQLIIPVFGTFNAGKSALLNAMLEAPLLPTGITAKTAVPTEIVYGDNIVIALRDGREQRLGLGELRGGADLTGVTLLRVLYRHPLLERIKDVCLVDMPGIDSGISSHDKVLHSYLKRAHACILVFTADEPVVKESVADFLAQLRLREIPVSTVMTKCDKLTPAELTCARQYLQENIKQTLGLDNTELLCLSSRGGVEPFSQLLLNMQERAGETAAQRLAAALAKAVLPLYDYLSLRLTAEQLRTNELEDGMKSALENIKRLDALLKEENDRFQIQAEQAQQLLTNKLVQPVNDMAAPIEAMLLEGQNPAPYIDDMLCMVLSSYITGGFEPLAHGYLKHVSTLLRLYGPSLHQRQAAGAAVSLDKWAETRHGAQALPSVQAALGSFKTTQPLLDDLTAQLQSLPRTKHRQEVHDMVAGLLPQLMHAAEDSLTVGIQTGLDNSVRLAEDAVSHYEAVWFRAFQEITAQREPWWDIPKQPREETNVLEKDLAAVSTVLTYIGNDTAFEKK